MKLQQKLDQRLSDLVHKPVDTVVEEVGTLIALAADRRRNFASEQQFKQFLAEGTLLNINCLSSQALSIPHGEYLVLVSNPDKSVLVPTSEDRDVVAKPRQYEIHTPQLLGAWNKIARSISEEQSVGPESAGPQPEQLRHSTDLADLFDKLPQSQADIAKSIGVDEPSVGRWTAPPGSPSHRTPTVAHIKRIADTTGVSKSTILNMAVNSMSAGKKKKKNSRSGRGGGAAWGGGNG